MPNQIQNPNLQRKYDLIERTAKYGEEVITFLMRLSDNPIITPIKSQLVRSATSIGANYAEADGAESKKDFIHKIGLCKKEAKESVYWVRMLLIARPDLGIQCRKFSQEAHELSLIFSSIIRSCK
ncbi:MAG: four helix bundle protein [Candidatus Roizmanbacteria bacterium]|nr:MAG: four helix bundle protein [Candidatus Roizmanbacteria bacterium]